ncbi:hypothetical protein SJ05684_b57650 (plasmid) [Sinorhizobium sojae CCBAU 05684]|uniref:Uncharacterized protein n=1 Tax=Sinorhizobium sojae CCBAU 05684 TaxID=716928 RepID=A0A249PLX2_9HYPH|nr:hypothetical protein [Sinorhizobium sojae]ASY66747.1 hypothetical protein SJ05684_b57650 [Sinorhizobium sojae CCBAU 05684]
MASEKEYWEILPQAGLGQLKFGDPKAAVDALEDIYGAVTRQASDRIPDSTLQDTLAQFGSDLSDEEKQALLALYAESGPDASSITEVRGDHGLVLRYEQIDWWKSLCQLLIARPTWTERRCSCFRRRTCLQ